jgi:hypothetical protein
MMTVGSSLAKQDHSIQCRFFLPILFNFLFCDSFLLSPYSIIFMFMSNDFYLNCVSLFLLQKYTLALVNESYKVVL